MCACVSSSGPDELDTLPMTLPLDMDQILAHEGHDHVSGVSDDPCETHDRASGVLDGHCENEHVAPADPYEIHEQHETEDNQNPLEEFADLSIDGIAASLACLSTMHACMIHSWSSHS